MGLVKSIVLPSLYEFWSDATVVTCSGKSSTTAAAYENVLIGNTSTPLWSIVSKGDALRIEKYVDDGFHDYWKRDIRASVSNPGVWTFGSESSTVEATKIDIYDSLGDDIYGYVLAALRFPSFSEAVVDAMLKGMEIEFLANAYNYASDPSSIYIADADLSSDPNDVYLQFACTTSSGYISATRGGTPGTAIMTSGSRAFWRHASSRYYFSVGGSSNSTTRAGGLYRLSL